MRRAALASAALLALGACKKSTPAASPTPTAPGDTALAASPEPSATPLAWRMAVVLDDGVAARAEKGGATPAVATLATGDTRTITAMTAVQGTGADLVWYRLDLGAGKAGWVAGTKVYVFDDDGLFQKYIEGTEPVESFVSTPEDAGAKKMDSADFYRRAAKNADVEVRRIAANRLLYFLQTDDEILAAWRDLQNESDATVRTNADAALINIDRETLYSGDAFRSAVKDLVARWSVKNDENEQGMVTTMIGRAFPDEKESAPLLKKIGALAPSE